MANLRVVSEQSDEAMKRKRAEEDLDEPLRELAANVLRIVRGAGKPEALLNHIQKVIDASVTYQKLHGHWPPSWTISNILKISDGVEDMYALLREGRVTQADIDRWEGDGTFERDHALHDICKGALQKCASQLLGQNTQERTGESDIHRGIRALDDIGEKRRQAAAKAKRGAKAK